MPRRANQRRARDDFGNGESQPFVTVILRILPLVSHATRLLLRGRWVRAGARAISAKARVGAKAGMCGDGRSEPVRVGAGVASGSRSSAQMEAVYIKGSSTGGRGAGTGAGAAGGSRGSGSSGREREQWAGAGAAGGGGSWSNAQVEAARIKSTGA